MNLDTEIKSIFAPVLALVAILWGLYELYDTLNKIKMIVDAINFIFGSYNFGKVYFDQFYLLERKCHIYDFSARFQCVPNLG